MLPQVDISRLVRQCVTTDRVVAMRTWKNKEPTCINNSRQVFPTRIINSQHLLLFNPTVEQRDYKQGHYLIKASSRSLKTVTAEASLHDQSQAWPALLVHDNAFYPLLIPGQREQQNSVLRRSPTTTTNTNPTGGQPRLKISATVSSL